MLAKVVLPARTSPYLLLAIAGLTFTIFVADIVATLGIAVWVLYLCPVVLSNFGWRPNLPIIPTHFPSVSKNTTR